MQLPGKSWRHAIPAALVGAAVLATGYSYSRSRTRPTPAPLQILSSYLDQHAAVALDGDSGVVVTKIEWQSHPATDTERYNEAAVTARLVRRHWLDPRLKKVSVVFERQTRLGPFVVGSHKYVVNLPVNALVRSEDARADGILSNRSH